MTRISLVLTDVEWDELVTNRQLFGRTLHCVSDSGRQMDQTSRGIAARAFLLPLRLLIAASFLKGAVTFHPHRMMQLRAAVISAV
jgi:hypothetical protein